MKNETLKALQGAYECELLALQENKLFNLNTLEKLKGILFDAMVSIKTHYEETKCTHY
jgi:hypothetical protein